jgi:hypothetical protein
VRESPPIARSVMTLPRELPRAYSKNENSRVAFEIALNCEHARGQLGLDLERFTVRSGQHDWNAVALVVAHEKRGRSAPAEAPDGATAVHFPRRRSHHAKETLGVDEFSDKGCLPSETISEDGAGAFR